MCTDKRAEAQSPGEGAAFDTYLKSRLKKSMVIIKLTMSGQEVEKVCVCKRLQAFWK